MRDKTLPKPYLETVARRTWTTWLLALIGALVLNAAFFALMPLLIRSSQTPPAFDRIVNQINVVRVKRPEAPVRKKIEKKEPEKPDVRKHPQPAAAKPRMPKLSLPFEINPRLPSGPGTVAFPELPPTSFDFGGFQDVFSAGELDEPLTVLSRIPPVYPMSAKRRHTEGWVRVRFLVEEDGSVGQIEILESKPNEIFDRSVIRCVSKWRFKPGSVEGIPVKAWAETTVRFELQ